MSVSALAALAPLFRYPDAEFPLHLAEARAAVPAVEAFARDVAALDPPALEVTYTSTFDLAPSCSPYLGVHLFGEDGVARARLMLGLRSASAPPAEPAPSRRREETELPDHIAEVLANAAAFEEGEWRELEELVLRPALARMNDLLSATTNPYRHLLNAASSLLPPAPCTPRPDSGGAS